MKYAVIKVVNGNYSIYTEGFTDISKAKVSYHGLCQTLWNEKSVNTACAMIVDENLNAVEGYREFISHVEEEE